MDFVQNVGRRSRIETSEVGAFIELGNRSLNGFERNFLYRNLGGDAGPKFADYGFLTGADRIEDGRAAACSDFDGDGDLDLMVQNYGAPAKLLINQGVGVGHWLRVDLVGTQSNRDAIGARVRVDAGGRRFLREVSTTAGYLAGQSLACHFGLGEATRIDKLEVCWPSGNRTVLTDVRADQRLRIVEPAPDASGGH